MNTKHQTPIEGKVAMKSPLTLEELKEKDFVMHQFYKGMDDPDDDYEGMNAPYDDMLLKFRNQETEGCCKHCFLIALKTVMVTGYCPQYHTDING